MDVAILYRGSSKDNQEAKNILREVNISFAEVFSEDHNHAPVLCTNESAYCYKGLNDIKEYASSVKFKLSNSSKSKD